MLSEIDGQTTAQYRQSMFLAEAAERRLARMAQRPGGDGVRAYRPTPPGDRPPPGRRADIRLNRIGRVRPGLTYHGARGNTCLEPDIHRSRGRARNARFRPRAGDRRGRRDGPHRRRRRHRQVAAHRGVRGPRAGTRRARARGRVRVARRRRRAAVRTDRRSASAAAFAARRTARFPASPASRTSARPRRQSLDGWSRSLDRAEAPNPSAPTDRNGRRPGSSRACSRSSTR